jgi:hypothetical protein
MITTIPGHAQYPSQPFFLNILASSVKALSKGHGPNNHVIKEEGSHFAQLRFCTFGWSWRGQQIRVCSQHSVGCNCWGEQRLRRCSQGWHKCLWDDSTDGPHRADNFYCVERGNRCRHPCVMQPFECIEGAMQPFVGIETTMDNLPHNPTNVDSNANLGSLLPYQLLCTM